MQVDGIISEYKEQGQRGAGMSSRPSSLTLRWINRSRPCSQSNEQEITQSNTKTPMNSALSISHKPTPVQSYLICVL